MKTIILLTVLTIGCLIAGPFIFKSSPISPIAISDLKAEKPVKDDRKYIPKDEVLKEEVPLGRNYSRVPGKEEETTILVSAKCDTCTAIYRKKTALTSQIGFYWEPKLFIGADSSGLIPLAFAGTIFRFDRYTLNGILGFPLLGIGLGYDITKNFYVSVGVDARILSYKNLSDIQTYSFDPLTLRPLAGIGFYF